MSAVGERLRRLEQLRGLLAAGDAVHVEDLAKELQVSARTVLRDLDLLRDQGLLIETERGRGGGVRLSRGHFAGDVRLSAVEAMDILLSLALAQEVRAPMLLTVRAISQKIAAIFARTEREKIRSLRKRILVGAPAAANILVGYRPEQFTSAAEVRSAFLELRMLNLVYRDQHGRNSQRTVEPQFLYLNPPAWYLLGWDHLRDGVRCFRIDRILAASVSDRYFRLRDAAPFLLAAELNATPL